MHLKWNNYKKKTASLAKSNLLRFTVKLMSWESSWGKNILDLLDFLDPDAVVGDVKVIEDVGGVILSEDLVDIQKALQDTGLAWKKCTETD